MRSPRAQAGTTAIELLIAMSIFALLIMLADTVFITATRSAKRAELAAEVQQNARMAVDRFTREIRESGSALPGDLRINNSVPGRSAVVFKSARLRGDATVFCVYVRTQAEPLYHRDCYSFVQGQVPEPPYRSIEALSPLGSYRPIWQRYIGYFLVPTSGGLHELRRVAVPLERPDRALPDPATLTGGEAVATLVQSLDVKRSGGEIRMTLTAAGTGIVLGRALQVEAILLPATVRIRN